jgi:hypothetical protein
LINGVKIEIKLKVFLITITNATDG